MFTVMKIPRTARAGPNCPKCPLVILMEAACSGVPYCKERKLKICQISCETWGLKWTMCSSASNFFPSRACSLPCPGREPQWACICQAWDQKFFFFKSFIEIHLEHSGNGSPFQAASFCRKVDLPCVTIVGHSQSRTLI